MNRKDQISRLISIMRANKLKYDRRFDSVLEHGFSDEARESFFEEVIADLESMLARGLNGEFNKSMKETIQTLTIIAVRAGDDGRFAIGLERLRQDHRNCMAAVKLTKDVTPEFSLRDNVKQYIDSAKIGMEVLKDAAAMQTDAEKNNMKTCKKLLEDISATVGNAIDVTSQNAADKYNTIMNNLHTWRGHLAKSGGMYDAGSVELLRQTLEIAKAWADINISNGRAAKIQDVYGVPEDDLTRAIESEYTKQNVEMFLKRCEAYAKETVSSQVNRDAYEKIKDLRAQIRDADRQMQDVVAQFKKEEIGREEAEMLLQGLQDRKDDLDYEIERLGADRISHADIELRREMIRKVERPLRQSYNHVKHNRLHIHALFGEMDFARLIGIINNNVSMKDFEAGIEELQKTMLTRGVIDRQGRVLVDNIKEKMAMVDQMTAELIPELSEKEKDAPGLLDQMLAKDKEKSSGSLLDQALQKTASRAGTGSSLDDIL